MSSAPLPVWLPPQYKISGNEDADLKHLYAIYQHDLKNGGLSFGDIPIGVNGRVDYTSPNSYEMGFWHLVSHGTGDGLREFEERRASRLPWCKPIIVNRRDPEVVCWDNRDSKNQQKTYLWLKNHRYVVILGQERDKRSESIKLTILTAFFVNTEKELDLKSRYARRVKL